MKYVWTTIYVKNLDASIKFYEDVVGLELGGRFPAGPGMEIGFLKSKGTDTQIELIQEEAFEGRKESPSISMGFLTENLEGKREELKAGGYEPTPIIKPNPQTQFFFLKDPDGIDVQFVQE